MGSKNRRRRREQNHPKPANVTRTSYKKDFLTFDEQIDLLRFRKMDIPEEDVSYARNLLRRIGYYRLSGYWYVYRQGEGQSPTPEEDFTPGVSLHDVEKLYDFDRNLRVLVFNAIESIEVALRALIGHTLGSHGSMAHTDPSLFRDSFTKADPDTGKSGTRYTAERYNWMHSEHYKWIKSAGRKTERSKADFVRHFKDKYGMPLPVWVVTEVIDFSDLSRIYEGMVEEDRSAVAVGLGVTDEEGKPLTESLRSWLRALTFVRNTCAHHSRLWNVNMVEQVAPSQPFPTPLQHLADLSSGKHARIYPTLAIISFLTAQINPGMEWKEPIGNLIKDAPPVPDYLDRMGFPLDWDQLSVWGAGPRPLSAGSPPGCNNTLDGRSSG
ncbi:Abi family protein [Corynebacterium sp. ED61]|uniref:Abi family protein n=1 Tax=Corynebacterium TaxID=1716 RepID=UPI001883D586|nr:Abi family protein [Corynebacterium sp. ED61]MBF0581497.1 Abi family protein [Corynebacterium sp. ED61]